MIKIFFNNIYRLKRITNRIEKRLNFPVFLFISPYRLICFFLERILFKKLPYNLQNYENEGGYIWHKINQGDKINIISAGIGTNIDFEEHISKNYQINKFICIDPTYAGKETIEKKQLKCDFIKGAVFNFVGKTKIFKPPNANDSNYSINNLFNSDQFINVDCHTIKSICEKYDIKNIDILKLDVEGIACDILVDCYHNHILPNQICFELEKPIFINQFKYFYELFKFNNLFKERYEIYYYTSTKLGQRVELLCIKK